MGDNEGDMGLLKKHDQQENQYTRVDGKGKKQKYNPINGMPF